ncbi:hypothetical protein HDU93_008424, partial [Gonapodya sp. JEL0774]
WFERRRGTALGLSMAGGGIGGLALSNLTQYLLDNVGLPWTLRISAFMAGGACAISSLFFIERFRPSPSPSAAKPFSFRWDYFRDLNFTLLFVSGILGPFGYFGAFYYVPVFGQEQLGLSPSSGALLVSLQNGMVAVGGLGMAMLSDILGPANILVTSSIAIVVSLYAFWTTASSYGMLLFFSLWYGFFGGGFTSVLPLVVARALGSENFIEKWGLFGSSWSIGLLCGASIAGAILDTRTVVGADGSKKIDFVPMILYCASMLAAQMVVLIVIRIRLAKETNIMGV